MHDASLAPPALQARRGEAAALHAALRASRADTLATFACYRQGLPGLRVPQRAELNPPLWELGHVGWFQDYWLARFPLRHEGPTADPMAPRRAPRRADADALYNSSLVPHDTRWSLPLPDAEATCADLAHQLAQTLALLDASGGPGQGGDAALYFFRLALLHEDMHHEAALYMAQSLGIAIDDARWQPRPLPAPPAALSLVPGTWRLGYDGDGFAFDNELQAHQVELPGTLIDAQVLRWAEYLPFVESAADDPQWWSAEGWAWRAAQQAPAPRYLRRDAGTWQQWRHGRWQPLKLNEAACHLCLHEAEAWCRWAGRRLPSEAEWERAALSHPESFRWGDVWEWTASAFAAYPGFVAHPYRDYSAPWFDGRPVLRGGSFMTQPRMRHARYRNFFQPHRTDVPAGFRSCAA
jgi:ergothioneine biosynthesis protein EgtB